MIHALGFSRWKHRPLRQCFAGQRVRFVARPEQVPEGATLAVWGMRAVPQAAARGWRVLRVEDGFLRSVGLGADLIRPLSWVVDGRGMYFDASQPSDLEVLLAQRHFEPELLRRAQALRQRLVASGLTKYNVGSAHWQRPAHARQVVLVPGQVESDASIALGAAGIRTNLALLQAARRACPDAWLLYKPHPDVQAGLRARGQGEQEAARWCDAIVGDVPMGALLTQVDAVHCLTSLAGFEALLRGKQVVCHGLPFYAGWGLTQDPLSILPPSPPDPAPAPAAPWLQAAAQRRARRLTLDELVAGALLLYPRYLSRQRAGQLSAEQALDELEAWRARSGTATPWWRQHLRIWLRRIVGVR